MIKTSLENIITTIKGHLLVKGRQDFITSVSTDSREIKKEDLYFALKGDRFNGIQFIPDVLKKKAGGIILNKNDITQKIINDCKKTYTSLISCHNTTIAYGDLARKTCQDRKGIKIAITGSSGKTTTKEILKLMLKEKFKVFTSKKNFNNHIGVPKSIFSIKKNYDFYIFEMGMNHQNEIKYLSSIVKPDISIITNIHPAHIQNFNSFQDIANAKAEIFLHQKKNSKTFLLDTSNFIEILIKKAKENDIIPTICSTKNFSIAPLTDNLSLLSYQNSQIKYSVKTPLKGNFNLENTSLALEVANELGIKTQNSIETLKKYQEEKSRFEILHQKPLIIDDAYNANPISMKMALSLLFKQYKNIQNKILILGDMLELGKKSSHFHQEIAKHLLKIQEKQTKIFFIGKEMKNAYKLMSSKNTFWSETNLAFMENWKTPENIKDTLIFFKASNGMNFKEIIKEIKCSIT